MNNQKKTSAAGLLLTAVCLCGCTYADEARWRKVDERTVTKEPGGRTTTHEKGIEERENDVKVDVEKPGWLLEVIRKLF